MTQRVHRDKLMFKWITKNHEIVVGFTHVKHGRCVRCGKDVPPGNTLCDTCFAQDKTMSKK